MHEVPEAEGQKAGGVHLGEEAGQGDAVTTPIQVATCILCYTILYYTTLHYTTLYYTIPQRLYGDLLSEHVHSFTLDELKKAGEVGAAKSEARKRKIEDHHRKRASKRTKKRRQEEGWPVRRIVGSRDSSKGQEFLVKWEGYDTDDDTWEPRKNVKDAEALDEWLAAHPEDELGPEEETDGEDEIDGEPTQGESDDSE